MDQNEKDWWGGLFVCALHTPSNRVMMSNPAFMWNPHSLPIYIHILQPDKIHLFVGV